MGVYCIVYILQKAGRGRLGITYKHFLENLAIDKDFDGEKLPNSLNFPNLNFAIFMWGYEIILLYEERQGFLKNMHP